MTFEEHFIRSMGAPDVSRKLAFRSLVVGLCQYEVTAIVTGKLPTLTKLSRKHRWLPVLLVGGLAGHLYRQRQPV